MSEREEDHMDDATNAQDSSLVREDELLGLFDRRRSDAAAFREGVAERIRSREQEAARSVDGPSASWRRAAGLAPGLFGGGAAAALKGLGVKTAGLKGLSLWFLLPAALTAAAFGVFAFGASSLRDGGPVPSEDEDLEAVQRRFQRYARAAWIGIFALMFLGASRFGFDLIVLWFVLAMASLLHGVRALAGQGELDRAGVTKMALSVLAFPAMQMVLHAIQLGLPMPSSDLGMGPAVAFATLAAMAATLARPVAVRVYGVFMGLVLIVLLNGAEVTYSNARGVRSGAENIVLDVEELRGWEDVADAYLALVAVGAEPFETDAIRASVLAAIHDPEVVVHPVVWAAAYDMGLLGPADLAALAAREGLERGDLTSLNPTYYYRYEIAAHLAAESYSEAELEAAAQEVLSKWPVAGDHGALDDVAYVLRGLEALGRDDLIDELARPALALLEWYWVAPRSFGSPFHRAGGFSSDPEKYPSFDDDTLRGLQLMARFGVPEGVDLRWVQDYLRRQARAFPLYPELMPDLDLKARAGLLQLREGIGLPERGILRAIVGERFTVSVVLAILLAALAIGLAPREASAVQGCQP
ncbi:MAG: hypothetical protein VX015_02445 [Planctomycetota bacterium]|nr:hypothetical protein [Planctomycetota bacterium]